MQRVVCVIFLLLATHLLLTYLPTYLFPFFSARRTTNVCWYLQTRFFAVCVHTRSRRFYVFTQFVVDVDVGGSFSSFNLGFCLCACVCACKEWTSEWPPL